MSGGHTGIILEHKVLRIASPPSIPSVKRKSLKLKPERGKASKGKTKGKGEEK